jgi:hypothetical protein
MRVFAYRLQADAFGSLDKSIQRMLRSGKDRGSAMPTALGSGFCKQQLWKRNFAARDSGPCPQRIVA